MTQLAGGNLTESQAPVLKPRRLIKLLGRRYTDHDGPVEYNGETYYPMPYNLSATTDAADLNGHQLTLTFSSEAAMPPNLIPNGQGQSGDNTNFSAFTRVPDPAAPGGVAFERTTEIAAEYQPGLEPDLPNANSSACKYIDDATADYGRAFAVWGGWTGYIGISTGTTQPAKLGPLTPGHVYQLWVRARKQGTPDPSSGNIGSYNQTTSAGVFSVNITPQLTDSYAPVHVGTFRAGWQDTDRVNIHFGSKILPDTGDYVLYEDIRFVDVTATPDTPIPIDAARDYLAALALEWVQKDGETATAPDYTLTVLCQNNTGNETGDPIVLESGTTAKSYAQLQDAIQSAQWPAGTTQILPSVTITTDDGSPATVRTANWQFVEQVDPASLPIDLQALQGYSVQPQSQGFSVKVVA